MQTIRDWATAHHAFLAKVEVLTFWGVLGAVSDVAAQGDVTVAVIPAALGAALVRHLLPVMVGLAEQEQPQA